MVSDKEDAVQGYVSDLSPLPFERPEASITSEHEVSVFRDVEKAVTVASNIHVVGNSGLDIGGMVVELNETEDEEERIACFLEGGCLCKLLGGTLLHSVYNIDAPRGSQ